MAIDSIFPLIIALLCTVCLLTVYNSGQLLHWCIMSTNSIIRQKIRGDNSKIIFLICQRKHML